MAKGRRSSEAPADLSQRRGADLRRWAGRREVGVEGGGCQGVVEEGEGVCCQGEWEVLVTSLTPSEPENRRKIDYMKYALTVLNVNDCENAKGNKCSVFNKSVD